MVVPETRISVIPLLTGVVDEGMEVVRSSLKEPSRSNCPSAMTAENRLESKIRGRNNFGFIE
jgi:hypothetical protein